MAGSHRVAIVGAGMGGLATAAALRRVGIEVAVYEQATQFARIGAGIQIGCNAMKVLRELGLERRLRAQSFYPRSWNNRDWRTGEIKFDMIFGESAERKFGAPYLLAHRGDLHAALATAVPAECVKLGHKLVGLDEVGDSVRLSFANGATALADAVVGADGVHSLVREFLFGTSPVNFTVLTLQSRIPPSSCELSTRNCIGHSGQGVNGDRMSGGFGRSSNWVMHAAPCR